MRDGGPADYYIDAVSGNDEAEGTSPRTAWKTIARADREEYQAGDRILLKCGQTFKGGFTTKGSGTKENPVVLSCYGEGRIPVMTSDSQQFIIIVTDVSNWIVENIEFTAPEGSGMLLSSFSKKTENITVRNCIFHDIGTDESSVLFAAIYLGNFGIESKITGIHLDSLKIYNVPWGIHMNGTNVEENEESFISAEESYNSDYVLENLYIENARYGGIVICSVQDCTVRNCRILNCATEQKKAYAPLWMRHSDRVTVEFCEIAGSTNPQDGMAVDFDGWTTNSTYRNIYSHDNTRFMRNCVYDSKTHNSGNSVYSCVSVNDSRKMNHSASPCISDSRPSFGLMRKFSFHDNIFIDGKPVFWLGTPFPESYNNCFSGSFPNMVVQVIYNILSLVGGVKFGDFSEDAAEQIEMITAGLPGPDIVKDTMTS